MTEIIMGIIEVSDFRDKENDWSVYDGYKIITDKQEIFFGISNGQSCCENWGYFSTPDDFKEFIGTGLLEVKVVDTGLNTAKLEELYLDEGQIMFVTFETTNGTLQFAAYNSHNGYYGHTAILRSIQLNEDQSL